MNAEIYNVENWLTTFYDNEAKFAAYNELPFDAMCIEMKVSNDVRMNIKKYSKDIIVCNRNTVHVHFIIAFGPV